MQMVYAQIVEECYFVFEGKYYILSSCYGKDRVYFVYSPPLSQSTEWWLGVFCCFCVCACNVTTNSTSSKESSSHVTGQVESIYLFSHKKGNVLEKFAICLYKS